MNSEEKSRIAKQLENTALKDAEVRGRSLLFRCCGERMIRINPNGGTNQPIVYCETCRHNYNPSIANFLDPSYASSGF